MLSDLSTVNIQLIDPNETKQESEEFSPETEEHNASTDQPTEDITNLVAQGSIQPVLISVPSGTYVLDNTTEEGTIVDEAHGHTIQELFVPHSAVSAEGCIMNQEADGGYIVDKTLPNQLYVVNPVSGEVSGNSVPPGIQFHVVSENVTDIQPQTELKVENQDNEVVEEEEGTANDETTNDHEDVSSPNFNPNDESQSVISTHAEGEEDEVNVSSNSADPIATETSPSASQDEPKLSAQEPSNDVSSACLV